MPPLVCPQLLFLPRSPTVGNIPVLSWLCPPPAPGAPAACWLAGSASTTRPWLCRRCAALCEPRCVSHAVFSITNPKYSSLRATVKTIPRRPNARGNRSVQVPACTYWSCICGFTLVFLPSSPSRNKFSIKNVFNAASKFNVKKNFKVL